MDESTQLELEVSAWLAAREESEARRLKAGVLEERRARVRPAPEPEAPAGWAGD